MEPKGKEEKTRHTEEEASVARRKFNAMGRKEGRNRKKQIAHTTPQHNTTQHSQTEERQAGRQAGRYNELH